MTPVAIGLSWLWQFGINAAAVGVVLSFFAYLFGIVVGVPLRWSEKALGG